MSLIPNTVLQQLREKGLLISEPFSSRHASFPDGVIVGKPARVPGNSIGNGFVNHYWGEPSDAPKLFLSSKDGRWRVMCEPGHGEFDNYWLTSEDAVKDVLDYYFGANQRMQEAQENWRRIVKSDSTQMQVSETEGSYTTDSGS